MIIKEYDDIPDPSRLEFNQKQESFYLEACMVLIEMLQAYESVKYDDIPLDKFENFHVNRVQRKLINCFTALFAEQQAEKGSNIDVHAIIQNAESNDE